MDADLFSVFEELQGAGEPTSKRAPDPGPPEPELGSADGDLPVPVDAMEPPCQDMLKSIRHEVVFPRGYPIPPVSEDEPIYRCRPPEIMPISYPYPLDPFQVRAVGAIHRRESVLVSAHTSAGKTTVAEYAIAQCVQGRQKVIYTSPIKALSNQKYQELIDRFPGQSVGIMTGDVTINRDANILVMTTEVLRNMLQQGAELLRELGFVIFDEVHYMRNSERGVVWEDTISMLSSRVRFVFLSATIPNAVEFACWVALLHSQPVHVIYTEYRPVPLLHYICPIGGAGLYPVCASTDRNKINQDEVAKAKAQLPFAAGKETRDRTAMNYQQRQNLQPETLRNAVGLLIRKECFPLIVFSFGKKRCEALAMDFIRNVPAGPRGKREAQAQAQGDGSVGGGGQTGQSGQSGSSGAFGAAEPAARQTLQLLTPAEVRLVDSEFEDRLKSLPEEDHTLRAVVGIRGMLRRGVAIHHSGLLPWVKELVEILFQNGLVKILLATETFAMGLNLPAKAIIFSDIRKFDGLISRMISSGEYTQMAGRAGRRGKDRQGLSISLFSSSEECDELIKVIQGGSEPLNSAYRLGWNAVLNLMRSEDMNVQLVIQRSFLQFQQRFRLPRCRAELQLLREEIREREGAIRRLPNAPPPEISVERLRNYVTVSALRFSERLVLAAGMHPDNLYGKLQPGRIARLFAEGCDFGWTAVLGRSRVGQMLYVDVLALVHPESAPGAAQREGDEPAARFMTVGADVASQFLAGADVGKAVQEFVSQPALPPIDAGGREATASRPQKLRAANADIEDVDFLYTGERSTDVDLASVRPYAFLEEVQPAIRAERLVGGELAPAEWDPAHCCANYAPVVVRVLPECLLDVSTVVVKGAPSNYSGPAARQAFAKRLVRTVEHLKGELPCFHPLSFVSVSERKEYARCAEASQKLTRLENLLRAEYSDIISYFGCSSLLGEPGTGSSAASETGGAGEPPAAGDEATIRRRTLLASSSPYASAESGIRGSSAAANTSSASSTLALNTKATYGFLGDRAAAVLPHLLSIMAKEAKAALLGQHLESADKVVLSTQLLQMQKVLFEYGYLECPDGVFEQSRLFLAEKGKVACQLSAANELILTECLFDSTFTEAKPAVLAGVLGSLLGEKSMESTQRLKVDATLKSSLKSLSARAEKLIASCADAGIELDLGKTQVDQMVNETSAALAWAWASGKSLQEIMDMDPSQFEGNVVRMLRRLLTLVDQILEALTGLSDKTLAEKLVRVRECVDRGIVQCNSLYTVGDEEARM